MVMYTDIKEQSPQPERVLKYSLKKTVTVYILRIAIPLPSPISSLAFTYDSCYPGLSYTDMSGRVCPPQHFPIRNHDIWHFRGLKAETKRTTSWFKCSSGNNVKQSVMIAAASLSKRLSFQQPPNRLHTGREVSACLLVTSGWILVSCSAVAVS